MILHPMVFMRVLTTSWSSAQKLRIMDFTLIIICLNQIRISLGMAMDGSLIQLIENFLSTAAAAFSLYRCVAVEDVWLVTKS